MSEDNSSLTPRITALRMLKHMHDDVSYEDIMRQLRILQHIEWTLQDIHLAGFPADRAVEEARTELQRSVPSGLVLRSKPLFSWQSLADRSEDDPTFNRASWIY